jgi:hypothetical protein
VGQPAGTHRAVAGRGGGNGVAGRDKGGKPRLADAGAAPAGVGLLFVACFPFSVVRQM